MMDHLQAPADPAHELVNLMEESRLLNKMLSQMGPRTEKDLMMIVLLANNAAFNAGQIGIWAAKKLYGDE